VRQKPILDELGEFAEWYTNVINEHYEENKVPEDKREKLDLVEMIQEAKDKEQALKDASDIPCGSLSQARLKKHSELDLAKFPYHSLIEHKKDLWDNLEKFYGIDSSKFPKE